MPGLLDSNQELGAKLAQGLDLPLNALRVSMESLCESMRDDEHGRGLVDGVLEEVERLGRNVRGLVELATPPIPRPLRCTAAEIAVGARHGLSAGDQRRVVLARIEGDTTIEVDGPLLTRVLHRLIENSLEAGSENVLMIVRGSRRVLSFTVVDHAPKPFDVDWAVPAFHSTKRDRLGLGLALAKRDLALIGASLEFRRTTTGETCATVSVPLSAEVQGD